MEGLRREPVRVGDATVAALGDWCRRTSRQPAEVVALSRICNRWPELVGSAAAEQSLPWRLRHRTLVIKVASSAWMHFFLFARAKMIERLAVEWPEQPIERIELRLGRVKKAMTQAPPPDWPDWRSIEDPGETVIPAGPWRAEVMRARAKLRARLAGLAQEGRRLCPECGINLIRSEGGDCSICVHRRQVLRRSQMRSALELAPWLSDAALAAEIPGSNADDCRCVRGEMILQVANRIDDWIGEHPEPETMPDSVAAEVWLDLSRWLMLQRSTPPDRLDLFALVGELPDEWRPYATPRRTGTTAC